MWIALSLLALALTFLVVVMGVDAMGGSDMRSPAAPLWTFWVLVGLTLIAAGLAIYWAVV
mgnify:CR=1 FL=1